MTDRIRRMADDFFKNNRHFTIVAEKEKLYMDAMIANDGWPVILRTARAVEAVLDNRTIFINDDDLLAGYTSREPYASEFRPNSAAWPDDDLDKIIADGGLHISDEDRKILRSYDDYWIHKGRDAYEQQIHYHDDRLWEFRKRGVLSPPWTDRQHGQGGFTMGVGWGAMVYNSLQCPDYGMHLYTGFDKFLDEARKERNELRIVTRDDLEKADYLDATIISFEAFERIAVRYADLADEMAANENNPERVKELRQIASQCRTCLSKGAKTFREGIQALTFYWMLFADGTLPLERVDQLLYPLYKADLEAGRITPEEAMELIQCYRLKIADFYYISGTPTQREKWAGMCRFNVMVLGGCDRDGNDAVNDLSYIREGVVDHAGNPLTASDVVFSYAQAAESSAYKTLVKTIDIANTVIEDDHTVLFALNYPYRYIEISPFTLVPVVTEAAFTADADGMINNPVGTGPYKMTSWTAGNEMVFEKFDGYWGNDAGFRYQNVDKIVLKVIGEATQRTIELETGNVDVLYDIPTTDLQYLKDSADYEIWEIPTTAVNTIQFNCSEFSACQDVRVRQAIAYAMDNQAIINALYNGYGSTLHCHVTENAHEYNPKYNDYDYYSFNVDKAKALMAEAGYANGLELTIITDETAKFISAAEILQSYLKEIGITLKITQYESAVYQSTWKTHDGGWDLYFRNVTAANCVQSPIGLLDYVNTPAATLKNETLQQLITDIQSDYGDVSALQDQIVEIMVNELPYYSYMTTPYLLAGRAGVISSLTVDMMGSLHPGDWTYTK